MFQPRLIGRDDTLTACRGLIAVPTGGVALCGPPGAGVSSVLREVFGRAVDAGDDVAFRRLPDRRLTDDDTRHQLVVVDDAHRAGTEAVAVLTELALRTRVVIGVHPHLARNDLSWLWRSGALARLDLRPLTVDEVAEMLRDGGIDGEVHGPTVATLHREAGGRPGFVVDIVRQAMIDGELTASTAMWRSVPNPLLGGEISERARDLLAQLPADLRSDVELVAVAGELPSHRVVIFDGPERRDVLQVANERVRVAPPALARAIRAAMTPADRRRYASEAAASPSELAPHDRVRVLLDAGESADTADLAAAIEHARRAGDAPLALDLSQRLAIREPIAGSLLHARNLAECGRRREAVPVYHGLLSDSDADVTARATAMIELATMSLWDLDDAIAAFEACRVGEHSGDAELARTATAMRAALAAHGGHPADALAAAAAVSRTPDLDRPWLIALGATMAASAVRYGTVGVSPRAAAALDAILAALPDGLDAAPLLAGRVLSSDICGALGPVRSMVHASAQRAVVSDTPTSFAWLAIAMSRIELAAGRAEEAGRWASDARRGFEDVDHLVGLRWAVAAELMAAGLGGDVAAARIGLTRLAELPRRAVAFLDSDIERAHAWGHAALGEHSQACSHLRAAAELALAQGAWALAAVALHDLRRLGATDDRWPSVVERVGLHADHPFLLHDAAMASGQPDDLLAAATALEHDGRLLTAAECAAVAAAKARTLGLRTVARRAASDVQRLRDECGQVSTPALDQSPLARLPPREREVARLAAHGVPSKQIATQLDLSVRTVDNALHRVYTRLGVGSRTELAQVLHDD